MPLTVRSQPPGAPRAPRRPRRTAVAALALAIAAALLPQAGLALDPPAAAAQGAAVAGAGAPSEAATRAARARLARTLGPEAVVDVDPATGTPQTLARIDGALATATGGYPAAVALRYARGHATALGLDGSDLSALALDSRVTENGITHLRWRQAFRGIPAYGNELRAAVDADGRVVAVGGAPWPDLSVPSTQPALGPRGALQALARDVGVSTGATVADGPSGPQEKTRFDTGDTAELVLFGAAGGIHLAWHVTYRAGSAAWYDAVVDATSGAVLHRTNLVKSAAAQVWDNYPGAPRGGTARTVDLAGFLSDSTRLFGPNVHAWADLNDPTPLAAPTPLDQPDAGEDVPPSGPGADFTYPFRAFTHAGGACQSATPCSWDHTLASSWDMSGGGNVRQNAVQAFWFANTFHDWLARAPISFTAASGAFDGNDRLLLETDDGADGPGSLPDADHTDNANMTTPPDGQSPVMQMYLFENATGSPFRDVNGGDDASIVLHEYTHGLSNRLVTNGSGGAGALNRAQAGAMGEGISDWYAKDYLVANHLETDTPAPGELDMGEYVDARPHQIRSEALDCPVGATSAGCPAGGYTYGDLAKVAGQPEVHYDGEIWAQTLWDIRNAIGDVEARRLITQGMRLVSPEPSFLRMRDAILQADTATGGTHRAALWAVFARRGMGFDATTSGASDTAPHAGFALPPTAPPAGTLVASPASVTAGQSVRLDAAGITDPDNAIVRYDWDFDGDGAIDASTTTPLVDHVYAIPGAFTARVTATDQTAMQGSATATVSVAAPPAPPAAAPAPAVTPAAVPVAPVITAAPAVAPRLALSARGTRARVAIGVACAVRCTVTARLTASKRLARRLKLGRKTTLGTLEVQARPGTRRLSVALSRRVVAAMRRAKLRRLTATLTVRTTDAAGRATRAARQVTVRR